MLLRTGLVVLLCTGALGADWPQYLGPDRNSVSTETGLLQAWPRGGPAVLWQRPVGSGWSGPVVFGGRLILVHRVGGDEVVECLDAATGKEHWKYAYPSGYRDDFGFDDGPRSTPCVTDGRVYTLGAEGRMHCLELATGKKVWDRALSADYQAPKGFFGVATSPLVEGDLVLVNVGGPAAGIVALDRRTGKEAWKATTHEASYSSPVAATLDGQRTVIFFTREGIVFLDPASGAVRYNRRWRARLNASVNAASPVVAGDLVFVSTSYGVGAVVLRVGKNGVEEVWKSDNVLSNHYSTSVALGGYLYGFDGRQESGASLVCADFRTGKQEWVREGFGCGSTILADGNLIILGERGDLILAEATPAAYKEKARATVLGNACRAQIALADGRLFARDTQKLVCLDLKAR